MSTNTVHKSKPGTKIGMAGIWNFTKLGVMLLVFLWLRVAQSKWPRRQNSGANVSP